MQLLSEHQKTYTAAGAQVNPCSYSWHAAHTAGMDAGTDLEDGRESSLLVFQSISMLLHQSTQVWAHVAHKAFPLVHQLKVLRDPFLQALHAANALLLIAAPLQKTLTYTVQQAAIADWWERFSLEKVRLKLDAQLEWIAVLGLLQAP